MVTVDLQKLEKAIIYTSRIADGNNPVNNTPSDDQVLSDPNVVRCMFFIRDVLQAVKDNNGIIGSVPKEKKQPFPVEVISQFEYQENKTITSLCEQINNPVPENCKKLNYKVITSWLKKRDYLIEVEDDLLGKVVTKTTEKGNGIGITCNFVRSESGREYYRVEYTKQAQEFIISNLPTMINEYEK